MSTQKQSNSYTPSGRRDARGSDQSGRPGTRRQQGSERDRPPKKARSSSTRPSRQESKQSSQSRSVGSSGSSAEYFTDRLYDERMEEFFSDNMLKHYHEDSQVQDRAGTERCGKSFNLDDMLAALNTQDSSITQEPCDELTTTTYTYPSNMSLTDETYILVLDDWQDEESYLVGIQPQSYGEE